MDLVPRWLREPEDYIVDNEAVVQLACWATGVYDKEYWYSGDIPDEVWVIEEAGLVGYVTTLIEQQGLSWKEALAKAEPRL